MKGTFRQSMAWLHTWLGLPVGVILYFIFLTGTPGYFESEISHWMRPEEPLSAKIKPREAIGRAWAHLQASAPRAVSWRLILPSGERGNTTMRLSYEQAKDAAGRPGQLIEEQLDPLTGERVNARATGGGGLLYRMHYQLHYVPQRVGYWLVEVCSMFMLVAIVTGVIVHKKVFKEFFTFRPGKQQRSWLDAHNVLCVVALPFHVMITYSGLLFFADSVMPFVLTPSYQATSHAQAEREFSAELNASQTRGAARFYFEASAPTGLSAPLAPIESLLAQVATRWPVADVSEIEVRHPGDAQARVMFRRKETIPVRGGGEHLVFDGVNGELIKDFSAVELTAPGAIYGALIGAHEGRFAGPILRWLYFISGVLGTAMVATGLVLWAAKRRTQLKHEPPGFGLVLVERLNVATIAGALIAMAAYFWANRLIPSTLETRAAWEAHALFITWAATLVHATLRPRERAWVEQLWLAAALFALLPMLNVVTTNRHLGVSLRMGDWALAGFDLTVLVLGAALAAAAHKVSSSFTLHRKRPAGGRAKASRVDLASAGTST